MLEELRGHPDELAQEPSAFAEHPSERQRRPSALVRHRYEDVGILPEERRKPSELVGKP
jgi:hypothetical protein